MTLWLDLEQVLKEDLWHCFLISLQDSSPTMSTMIFQCLNLNSRSKFNCSDSNKNQEQLSNKFSNRFSKLSSIRFEPETWLCCFSSSASKYSHWFKINILKTISSSNILTSRLFLSDKLWQDQSSEENTEEYCHWTLSETILHETKTRLHIPSKSPLQTQTRNQSFKTIREEDTAKKMCGIQWMVSMLFQDEVEFYNKITTFFWWILTMNFAPTFLCSVIVIFPVVLSLTGGVWKLILERFPSSWFMLIWNIFIRKLFETGISGKGAIRKQPPVTYHKSQQKSVQLHFNHNKWLFLNQWFGLHLRWSISNDVSSWGLLMINCSGPGDLPVKCRDQKMVEHVLLPDEISSENCSRLSTS